MRQESPTDFTVTVEGIGTFRFARRTMRDQVRIDAEFVRLTDGLEDVPAYLERVAGSMALLRVLTVSAPEGWDLDRLDPLEGDSYRQLLAVSDALREKEHSFRRKPETVGQGAGAGAGGDGGVLVPPQVQPAADGSEIP